jgi:hypothetical protein
MELKPWNCPRCTFLNHEELIECECCNYNHKEHQHTQDITNLVESSIIDDSSCCICNEPCNTSTSARCSNLHSTCNDCLQNLVQASLEPEILRRDKGAITCPWIGRVIGPGQVARCVSTKWDLETLRPLLSPETHAICTSKMKFFVTALMTAEANLHGNLLSTLSASSTTTTTSVSSTGGVSRYEKIQRYRLRLIEALNLRCPRCATVFFDYDGCDALKCQSCATAFCAICLKDCGNDAHSHVQQVHSRMHSTRDQFEAAHADRRAKIIAGALMIMDEADDVKIDVLLTLETEMQPMQITRNAVLDNIPGGLGMAGNSIRERTETLWEAGAGAGGGRGGGGRGSDERRRKSVRRDNGGGGGGYGEEEEDVDDHNPTDTNSIVAGALLVGGMALVSAFLTDGRPPPPAVFAPLQRAVPDFLTTIFNNVYNNARTVNEALSTTRSDEPGASISTSSSTSAAVSMNARSTGDTSTSSSINSNAAGALPLSLTRDTSFAAPLLPRESEGGWTCIVCTLLNTTSSINCAACRHQKGSTRHMR